MASFSTLPRTALICCVSLLLFSIAATAQTQRPPTEGHGITVIRNKWHRESRNPDLERDPNQEASERQEDERRRREIERINEQLRAAGMPTRELPSPRIDTGSGRRENSIAYIYEVRVRNDGHKDISSVTWEYVFFTPGTENEVGRRRFESKSSIGRGKTRTLTSRSAIPPTGTIDATKPSTNEKYSEKIVIKIIKYADGTKWPGG